MAQLFEKRGTDAVREIRWLSCLKKKRRRCCQRNQMVQLFEKKGAPMPSEKSDGSVVFNRWRADAISVIRKIRRLKKGARMPLEKSDGSVV